MVCCYLLSLAPERLGVAETALRDVAFQRVQAVDGRGDPAVRVPGFGRLVSGSETACSASHRLALQMFLDTGDPLGVVLEDDVASVDVAGLTNLAATLKPLQNWDVLHLSATDFGFRTPWQGVDRAHLFPMTTGALLWSRDGAQAFLNAQTNWPMDHALRRWTLNRNGGLGLRQSLVTVANAPSLMDGRDALMTPAYLKRRRLRRRLERAHAAWNRFKWRRAGQ